MPVTIGNTTVTELIELSVVQFVRLMINTCTIEDIDFKGQSIHTLTLRGVSKISCEFRAQRFEKNLIINNLFFRSFKGDSKNISFDKVEFNHIGITKTVISHSIDFNDCVVESVFSVRNSVLGKTTFNNISLEKTCKVVLIDTNITDTIFTNFRWNNNYQLNDEYDKNKYNSVENYTIALRESYRQLKANYLKNGNKIEALEFQKLEMEKHFEILSIKKNESWLDRCNYFIAWTYKASSDFGQNVWKPFKYLFISHLILFNFMLCFNKIKISIAWPWEWEYDATIKGISLYFQTILPTHFATVKDFYGNDTSIGGFWDFLMRISAGYFIFYFISASRKYHQSSGG